MYDPGYTTGSRSTPLSPPSSSTREPRPRRNMRSCDTKIMVPSKFLQGVHQHLLGRKIQVISRFVEHQEVRRVVEHARYCQPRFFAAGECADLLVHVFAGELECSRSVPQRPEPVLGKILLQLFDDGEIGIERV